MQINNRSIQDMQIFGDPSRIPVVIIEQHIMNVPLHCSSDNLLFSTSEENGSPAETAGSGEKNTPEPSAIGKRGGRVLKVVVFVHGFQVSLILFMLKCENMLYAVITVLNQTNTDSRKGQPKTIEELQKKKKKRKEKDKNKSVKAHLP